MAEQEQTKNFFAQAQIQTVIEYALPTVQQIIQDEVIPAAKQGHVHVTTELFDALGLDRTSGKDQSKLMRMMPSIVLAFNYLGYQVVPESEQEAGCNVYNLHITWAPVPIDVSGKSKENKSGWTSM